MIEGTTNRVIPIACDAEYPASSRRVKRTGGNVKLVILVKRARCTVKRSTGDRCNAAIGDRASTKIDRARVQCQSAVEV